MLSHANDCSIVVINATNYDWSVQKNEYQMTVWNVNWPDTIAAGSTLSIQTRFRGADYEGGDAYISLKPDERKFTIEARTQGQNQQIKVKYDTLQVVGNNANTELMLLDIPPEEQDAILYQASAVLSQDSISDQIYGHATPTNWMHRMIGRLGHLTIKQMCLPSSHDAGMSEYNSHTIIATANTTKTQALNIRQQLEAGARFFDIRPVSHGEGGELFTGHFGPVKGRTEGALGQSINDVCDEIKAFTDWNNSELLIFELSHPLIKSDKKVFDPLSQNQWNFLFSQLSSKLDTVLFHHTDGQNVDLNTLTLNDFIGGGRPAVIFTVSAQGVEIPPQYWGNGFFYGSGGRDVTLAKEQLKYDGFYSDKFSAADVAEIQFQNLQNSSHSPYPFGMWWTLTPTNRSEAASENDFGIVRYSANIHYLMYSQLFPKCTSALFPNLIWVDNFNTDVTALCIAVNNKFAPMPPKVASVPFRGQGNPPASIWDVTLGLPSHFRLTDTWRSGTSAPAINSMRRAFTPCQELPSIAIGLNMLDIDCSRNIRIYTAAIAIDLTGFTAQLNTWDDTKLWNAQMVYFPVGKYSYDCKTGVFRTKDFFPPGQIPKKVLQRIQWGYNLFGGPPDVVCWIRGLDFGNSHNTRLAVWPSDIDSNGFTLHIESWGDSEMYGADVTWIAHTKGFQGLTSGSFNTIDVNPPGNGPKQTVTGTVKFDQTSDWKYRLFPALSWGFNYIDCDHGYNLRLASSMSNNSTTTSDWSINTWGDSIVYHAGCSYIARPNPADGIWPLK